MSINYYDIDEIMNMFDWNNPLDVQEIALEMARGIRCINVFILPCHSGHCKNVWDNCAKILAEKSDGELRPYLSKLMVWLQDLNWPGAYTIFERLKYYEGAGFDFAYNCCVLQAKALDEEMWLSALKSLKEEKTRKTGDGSD